MNHSDFHTNDFRSNDFQNDTDDDLYTTGQRLVAVGGGLARSKRQSGVIAGATAAVVALLGIGAVVAFGGGSSNTTAALPLAEAPVATQAVDTAPVEAAPVVPVAAETPVEAAAPATTEAPAPAPVVLSAPVDAPAPAPTSAPLAPAPAPVAPASAPIVAPAPAPASVCPTYFPKTETPYGLCEEGPAIAMVQQWLNYTGEDVVVDGQFGPATLEALKRMQAGNGLDVNGLITERFLTVMGDRLSHEEPADEIVADHEDEIVADHEGEIEGDEAWGQDDAAADAVRKYDYCIDMVTGVTESTPEAIIDCNETFGW